MTTARRSLARANRHDPSRSLVGFAVGEGAYAVPIAQVKEIVNPMPVVRVPRAPREVVGVADYRGDVVPVVDLRVRLGLPPAADAPDGALKRKCVVVDVGGRLAALLVDAVTEVFGTGGAGLRPAPALGGDAQDFAGVATYAGRLVFVIDSSRLRDLVEPLAADGRLGPAAATRGSPQGSST